ncbi:hypothetical protein AB0E83_24425 [Streptomyces sp. NPDC035033]|uniref:hypothetical protein n=1 Tax=Streptomyces sp. NPDC035033 TaxID=3155368 RepID=UPI0033EA317E
MDHRSGGVTTPRSRTLPTRRRPAGGTERGRGPADLRHPCRAVRPSPQPETRVPAKHDPPPRRRLPLPPVLLFSSDVGLSESWASALRRAGLPVLGCRPWGDGVGYAYVLDRPEVLALLDVPRPHPGAPPLLLARSLALIGPTTVAVPAHVDPVPLLDSGVLNTVRRDDPPRELAARIAADARRLRKRDPAPRRDGSPAPDPVFRSQCLLLEILCRAAAPVCCHDLRRLLGHLGRPLSLPALRGRLERLTPHLAERGLALTRSHSWGQDVFQAVSLDRPRPADALG